MDSSFDFPEVVPRVGLPAGRAISGVHIAGDGDTLHSISTAHYGDGRHVDMLRKANGIFAHDDVRPGQHITLPVA